MLLLLATCSAAFDVHRDGDGAALRWPAREVAVFVVATSFGGVPVGTLELAVQDAIGGWNGAGGTALTLVYGGRVSEPTGFDITVWLRDKSSEFASGEPAGHVEFAVDGGGVLRRADVGVNVRDLRYGPDGVPSATRAELRAVVRHLIGHAIGVSHSADLRATMGFLPLDGEKISLEDDDRSAVRHLYGGAVAKGRACDACDGDGDCSDGARCLRWPTGSSYCAPACSTHADCAIGQSCADWAEGKACFPNGAHCAPDLAKASPSGPCASDVACGGQLFCLVLDDQGFCTAGCVGNCGPFGTCTGVLLGNQQIGLCLAGNSDPFGALCLSAPDCAGLLCAPSAAGGGRCSAPCSDGCPESAVCGPDGLCALAGERGLGWPCASGFDCASALCVPHGDVFENVCATACTLASDCPPGTGCTPGKGGSFCLPFGAAPLGFPCLHDGSCGQGQRCVAETNDGIGGCRLTCDAFGDGIDCADGGRCTFADGKGACMPSGGGGVVGSPCEADLPCRVDLVCAADSAQAEAGVCVADCDLADGRGCSAGVACVPLAQDIAWPTAAPRGVCSASGSAKTRIGAGFEASTPNFAGRPLNMKSIKAWAPVKPTEPVPADGCSAGRAGRSAPGPASGWLWALGVGLLGACAARTRRVRLP
jgi:hypothetical protein